MNISYDLERTNESSLFLSCEQDIINNQYAFNGSW